MFRQSASRSEAFIRQAMAVKALCHGYMEIQTALVEIAQDKDEPRDVAHAAESLSKKMDKLETKFLTIL